MILYGKEWLFTLNKYQTVKSVNKSVKPLDERIEKSKVKWKKTTTIMK